MALAERIDMRDEPPPEKRDDDVVLGDDWVAPDLARHVRAAFEADVDGVYWRRYCRHYYRTYWNGYRWVRYYVGRRCVVRYYRY